MSDKTKSRRTFLQSLAASGIALVGNAGWSRSFVAAVMEESEPAAKIAWTGTGNQRVNVRVLPIEATHRQAFENPTEVALDISQLTKTLDRAVDVNSFQIIKYDPNTGKPELYAGYAYARSPYDRPFRWYDASIPYEFPEFYNTPNRTDGIIKRENRIRAGYFYSALGEWRSGRLAWTHTQLGAEPSYYSIYFNLLPPGETPSVNPPVGWLSDGLPRFDEVGESTTGASQVGIAVDDWDDDGKIDIVFGEDYGHLFWMPNMGSVDKPEFTHYKMIFDSEGLPIDAGMGSQPLIVDWDGDGKKDLLIGTHWNRILYFKNVGSNRERKLVYKGFLMLDGKPLELPVRPLEKGSEKIFTEDYYPVLDAVDWNGDGRPDLLAGGYVTGRIYYYENVGSDSEGMPILKFRGPLEADGKPINVEHWCASPCAADFDGDGDLDLITGRYSWDRPPDPEQSLRYYENVGTRTNPLLTERPFPKQGQMPNLNLSVPRAVDLNGNGLLDLVVSCGGNIYIFENTGTKSAPRFRVHDKPIPSRWTRSDLPGTGAYYGSQFMDWNGDGKQDVVTNFTVKLNSKKGNPGTYDQTVSVLPPGEKIDHSSGIGDDWLWARLYDLDQDGKLDVLFGDWAGHVWFHRNLSEPGKPKFDTEGYKLQTVDGKPIKVGPIDQDPNKSFLALQGARTVFTMADFDDDGLLDLVVSDTLGIVRYYRNAGTKEKPIFDLPVVVANMKDRGMVDAVDWNGNGKMDLIVSTSAGEVVLFPNTGGRGTAKFGPAVKVNLPPIVEPRVIIGDITGNGDQELFIPGTQGSSRISRLFLDHGYAKATILGTERRGRG